MYQLHERLYFSMYSKAFSRSSKCLGAARGQTRLLRTRLAPAATVVCVYELFFYFVVMNDLEN